MLYRSICDRFDNVDEQMLEMLDTKILHLFQANPKKKSLKKFKAQKLSSLPQNKLSSFHESHQVSYVLTLENMS